MRKEFRLTPTNPNQSLDVDFPVANFVIQNPTASPIYIRTGAPDIPDASNANVIVPAAQNMAFATSGYTFGVRLGIPSALIPSTVALSGLFSTAIIVLLSAEEAVPAYGSSSFLTLSTSQLTNGIVPYVAPNTSATFDIGAWGGALIYINPTSGSGQGVAAITVSSDGVTFTPLGTFAFWPGVPSVLQVPRVARYFSVTFNSTAIVGEPAIAGSYSVRATIEELQDLTYNPTGQPITKAYALAPLAASQFFFVTAGLPAVSIAAIATAGTGASAAITLLVESSSNLTDWRQVTFRTQRMSIGITLYRAVGSLDRFIRVTVFEVGGVSIANGNVYFSIPPVADTAAILNTIQQTLGDTGAPSNTNQDIFHVMDSIRVIEAAALTNLTAIAASTAAIDVDTSQISANTSTIPTINTNIADIETDVDTLLSYKVASNNALVIFANPAPNVWTNYGALVGSVYITDIASSSLDIFPPGVNVVEIALGSAAAPSLIIYVHYWYSTSPIFSSVGPNVIYSSPRAAGQIAFQANNLNNIWVRHNQANLFSRSVIIYGL